MGGNVRRVSEVRPMFCGSSLQGLIFIFDKTRLKATQRKVEVLKLVALFVYQLPLLIVPLAQLFYHIRVGRHCLVEGTWLLQASEKERPISSFGTKKGQTNIIYSPFSQRCYIGPLPLQSPRSLRSCQRYPNARQGQGRDGWKSHRLDGLVDSMHLVRLKRLYITQI